MTVDLRAYTTRAKELEVAIYTQNELMRQHEMLLKEQRPVPPRKESAVAPPRPVPPPPPPVDQKFYNNRRSVCRRDGNYHVYLGC